MLLLVDNFALSQANMVTFCPPGSQKKHLKSQKRLFKADEVSGIIARQTEPHCQQFLPALRPVLARYISTIATKDEIFQNHCFHIILDQSIDRLSGKLYYRYVNKKDCVLYMFANSDGELLTFPLCCQSAKYQ